VEARAAESQPVNSETQTSANTLDSSWLPFSTASREGWCHSNK